MLPKATTNREKLSPELMKAGVCVRQISGRYDDRKIGAAVVAVTFARRYSYEIA